MLCHGILGQMQETLLSRVSLGSPWSEAFQGPHPPVSGRGGQGGKVPVPWEPPWATLGVAAQQLTCV